MAYPNHNDIMVRAATLDVDPILAYAYSAFHGRIPTNRSELEAFVTTTDNWLLQYNVQPSVTLRHYVWGYVQVHGGFPPSMENGLRWLASIGAWTGGFTIETGQPTGVMPSPGQGYPPGGSSVTPVPTPSPTPSPTPTPNPTPGGAFDFGLTAISAWIKAHPMQAAGLGVVGYFVFLRRRR